MKPELVVIGALLIDEIFYEGCSEGEIRLGGGALYSALAAANCGIRVGLVAVIGNDYPNKIIEKLAHKNIDIRYLRKIAKPSCRCQMYYQGDNRSYKYPDEYAKFEEVCPTIQDIPHEWLTAKGFHVAPFIYDYQAKMIEHLVKTVEGSISVDPVDIIRKNNIESYLMCLRNIEFFMPSEVELNVISSNQEIKSALKYLAKKLNAHIVLKRSDKGSLTYDRLSNHFISFPANTNCNVIDITGAGDAFCGAFHATWIKTGNINQAIAMATKMASLAITGKSIDPLIQ